VTQKRFFSHFALLTLISFTAGCSYESDTTQLVTGNPQVPGDSTLARHLPDVQLPFSIQVAAVRKSENADKLRRLLNAAQFSAYIVQFNSLSGTTIYRVRVGPFADRVAALRVLTRLKRAGYADSYIVNSQNKIGSRRLATKVHRRSGSATAGSEKQITENLACRNPQWSPSGREVAFYAVTPDREGIFTVGTGGGPISQVVLNSAELQVSTEFQWAPDGERIAFAATELSGTFEPHGSLWIINKSGRKLRRVFSQGGVPFAITDIAWAPDGHKIAFTANYHMEDGRIEPLRAAIVLLLRDDRATGADGKNVRSVELTEGDQSTRIVGWESEDTCLLLMTEAAGYGFAAQNALWLYDLRSGTKEPLRSAPALPAYRAGRLLAGTKQLIYTTADGGGDPEERTARIVAVELDTGRRTVLFETREKKPSDLDFVVSKSSKIFLHTEDELWIYGSDGRESAVALNVTMGDFTVSPLGGRICFVSGGDLFTMKLEKQVERSR